MNATHRLIIVHPIKRLKTFDLIHQHALQTTDVLMERKQQARKQNLLSFENKLHDQTDRQRKLSKEEL